MSARTIPVVERIMSANDAIAVCNREILDAHGVHAVNVMASPGAGKTSLIVATIEALRSRVSIAGIDGDLASSVDSDRIRAAGVPAIQINTGGNCHLDAPQIQGALKELPLDDLDLVFIENVGNLVCPVGFALGEHTRVAVSSVPEGDDKPLKYPSIFSSVDAVVINKVDLLPYITFDLDEFARLVRGLNPDVRLFQVSCTTGVGLDDWTQWLLELVVT